MSLLLSRVRHVASVKRRSSSLHLLLSKRDLSSTSSLIQKQTSPCLIVGLDHCGPGLLGRLVIQNVDRRGLETIIHLEKKVHPEVVYSHIYDLKMVTIGASHGWVATLKDKDGIMRLQDDLIPVVTSDDTPPKRIPLPPLVTLQHCQTRIVTNVSMSSSSPEDEDCVVAVKFLGPQLSFCRPSHQKDWTRNIKIENPCFYSSRVMFSKRDEMFRIPGSGGHLIGSWDPMGKHKIQKLRFENIPELTKTTRELLDSYCTIQVHLVDSPSTGETFMVKQYKKTTDEITKRGVSITKTEFVMVFKLEDGGNAVYTRDIGDLVIFISKSEPFCVPASSFPGLWSNTVEIVDPCENLTVLLGFGDDHPVISSGITENSIAYYIPPQNID